MDQAAHGNELTTPGLDQFPRPRGSEEEVEPLAVPAAELEALFMKEANPVVMYVRFRSGGQASHDDATDARQEAFAQIARPHNWRRFESNRPGFLRRVAWRAYMKERGKRSRYVLPEEMEVESEDWADGPISAVDMDRLLERLAPKQQKIMRMIAEGLNSAEIAELVGVAAATVRSHLRQVRRKFKSSEGKTVEPPTAAGEGEV